ncbi:hypothetical protein RM533_03300 [Croceicoccus sp. F390]|uniref:Uncharacterized protein n=1 Tax=Croceicoccus esteveae TaxID=3075597 RepID=A0ABU2ZFX9_9SPHN|nr:hypothetical protein [Croceicoccus sp. F390]MDT0575209.1 hypothetical protein [Croceicoccus sp. F390]
MNRRTMIIAALLAGAPLVALQAQDAPRSLLPPGMEDPAPPAPASRPPAPNATPATPLPAGRAPQNNQGGPRAAPASESRPPPPAARPPAVSPRPVEPRRVASPAPGNTSAAESRQPVQQASGGDQAAQDARAAALEQVARARSILARLRDGQSLDAAETDELDKLLGLSPIVDIPASVRRSTLRVGLLGPGERGMAQDSLAGISGTFVRNVLAGIQAPLVSRWGHILLRRALASRLHHPAGLDGAEFTALRSALLLRLGEGTVARALVQQIDTGDYSPALIGSAYEAHLATGDITGACPMVRLHGPSRDDAEWQLLREICATYSGEASGMTRLQKALRRAEEPAIDVLLAQKYAGAFGAQRRAVTIEWDDVDDLTLWRFALATATGAAVPEKLMANGGRRFALLAATSPSVDIVNRSHSAQAAASAGILSSTALVDLYSRLYEAADLDKDVKSRATLLREAYVAAPAGRLTAIRSIWDDADDNDRYGFMVLTAYAAARLPPAEQFADAAGPLIGSMLAAGLDRNAMRWAETVPTGSLGWALLTLADPAPTSQTSEGALRSFVDNQEVSNRKASFLVAGLAGLDRLDAGDARELADELGFDLDRRTRWSQAIGQAGQRGNQPLVAFLAALGMQGQDWSKMTPFFLYSMIAALQASGLEAEARMIAAEAVARG